MLKNATKSALKLSLSSLLTLTFSFSAFAATPRPTGPSVRVNPDSLREMILNGNTSILLGMNQISQSKEQVNIARGNLLPSLNIGIAAAAGSGFVLSAVSILLPFLLPSNWYALDASKKVLQADGFSYYLVELNTYASGMGLYTTINGDLGLRAILAKQAATAKQIQNIVNLRFQNGLGSATDVSQATANAQIASLRLVQMDQLLAQEKASLRKALALSLDTQIQFDTFRVPASPVENSNAQHVLDSVYSTSPEARQLVSLQQAGRDEKKGRVFGFISGASLSLQNDYGGSQPSPVAFNQYQTNGNLNFGFAYAPAIRLADLQVEQLNIRLLELRLEQSRIIETVLSAIENAKRGYSYASGAEANLQNAYDATLMAYRSGSTDVLHLLDANNQLTTASTERVRAQSELDSQRLTLQRILISGWFAKIQDCVIDPNKRDKMSIEEFCTGQAKVGGTIAANTSAPTAPQKAPQTGRH